MTDAELNMPHLIRVWNGIPP